MEEEKKKNEEEQVVPTTENNVEKKKSGNKHKGLVIAIIIVIILLILALLYVLLFTKDEDNNKPQVSPTPVPTDIEVTPTNEPEENGDYELAVYKYKDSKHLYYSNEIKDFLEVAFTIKVKEKDAKVLYVDDYYYVLYQDDKVYLYNVSKKTTEELKLEKNYLAYELIFDWQSNVIGVSYLKSDYTTGFYNLQKKIKLYDGKYKAIDESNDPNDKLRGRFETVGQYIMFSNYSDSKVYLLNKDYEKIELSYDGGNSGTYVYTEMGDRENSKIFYGLMDRFGGGPLKLYTKSLKLFYDKQISIYSINPDTELIYIVDGKNILKYNFDGNLLNTLNKDYDIKEFYHNYVLYVKDGELILENVEDATESKVLTKWNDEWEIYELYYYDRKTLDNMEETDKKEGLYVIIQYSYDYVKTNADGKGYYGMEYCYTPDKQIVEYPVKEEMGGREKPVLYLYPTKETNVMVTFAHPEYLTTTYPKYTNSWNVTAKPNGDLRDSDGKYYYALYWDEKRYSEVDFKEGFYVEGKDAINFLEEKLAVIGLNDKERNEFIMYWLPIMESNGKNLVYFELTKEREINNKLIITPKPDSLLRISIHIKKVNSKVNIPEQKLETFSRSGFTAVEWGGMTY